MYRLLEVNEEIECGDDVFLIDSFNWLEVGSSSIGSIVQSARMPVRRKISDTMEVQKPSHNSDYAAARGVLAEYQRMFPLSVSVEDFTYFVEDRLQSVERNDA